MKKFHTYPISEEHAGFTVEAYLKLVLHYSGRKIQKLTRLKGIRLNGKPVFLQKKIKASDNLQILLLEDKISGLLPEAGAIDILFEDEYLLVVNKPAGQLVHPAGRTASGTLSNYLAYYMQQRGATGSIRPLHRLDRDTSGCVLFAKDAYSQFLLEEQLKGGNITRTYYALVKGTVTPSSGAIIAPIGPHPSLPNRRSICEQGEPAVTNYRVLNAFNQISLLELSLETGRTHQIRLHMAHIGHPLIGDGMYGVRVPWIKRQALHAISLTFQSLKDQQEITVYSPLPDDFTQALAHCEAEEKKLNQT